MVMVGGRRYSPFKMATISTPMVATVNAPSPDTTSASVQLPGSRRESIVPTAAGGMLAPMAPNVVPRVIILRLLLSLLENDSPSQCNLGAIAAECRNMLISRLIQPADRRPRCHPR